MTIRMKEMNGGHQIVAYDEIFQNRDRLFVALSKLTKIRRDPYNNDIAKARG